MKSFFKATAVIIIGTPIIFCQISCKPKPKPILPKGTIGFYELYHIDEMGDGMKKANLVLKKILDSSKTNNHLLENGSGPLPDQYPLNKFFLYFGYAMGHDNLPMPDRMGNPTHLSEIGGVRDNDTMVVGKYLRMPEVLAAFPPNTKFAFGSSLYETNSKTGKKKGIIGLYALKTVRLKSDCKLKGNHITDVDLDYDSRGRAVISIKLDSEGAGIFARMTRENINRPLAVVLNNYVCTAPNIISEINGGKLEISGNYSTEDAEAMVNDFKSAIAADKLHLK